MPSLLLRTVSNLPKLRDELGGQLMTMAKINRLIRLFNESLQALSAKASMADAEQLAMLVHHSMEAKTRAYHTAEHVFDICNGINAHQQLAALFHDVVYYQLDGGFPKHVLLLLRDVVRLEGTALVVRETQDADLALCLALFGFSVGQPLPLYAGMNEFLSAVVATKSLHGLLTQEDLIAIVACIEATIPFRSHTADGETAAQALARRIQMHTSSTRTTRIVKDAVVMANRDVGSFAQSDPGVFLSNTWLLIEESNAPLQAVGLYSLQEYRSALMRMRSFLSGLDPTTIFQSFEGTPDEQNFSDSSNAAKRNITFTCDFLDTKITSIGIIEALALSTGGDCPVSMLLGDIANIDENPTRVEDFLPPAPTDRPLNPKLLRVFSAGRSRESNYDLTVSPLTAYIYQHLGHAGTQTTFMQASQMFASTLSPLAFLRTLDQTMLGPIITACAEIAISRKAALQNLEKLLQSKPVTASP